jgi:predicted DNA-binding protein
MVERISMSSPLTLRLERKTRQRIARIASRKQISTSEVVRQAIEAWVERQEPIAAPYEAMADLIGIVNGGKPERSAETGRRFREVLKSRRKQP